MNYYKIPRISNSHLSEFKAELMGVSREKPQAAFDFGSAFHQQLLEPHKEKPILETHPNYAVIDELISQAKAHQKIKWLLQWSWKERIKLFTDKSTGLECKLKSDLNYRGSTIIDLKTTSAWSREVFIEHALKFDYDRQAAFYLDGLEANNFHFIAIQKRAPHKIFHIDTAQLQNFIPYGRKKYQFLLKKWKQQKPVHLLPTTK